MTKFQVFGPGQNGLLFEQIDTLPHDGSTRISRLARHEGHTSATFDDDSTVYGFVVAEHISRAVAQIGGRQLHHGDWFCAPGYHDLLVAHTDASVVVIEVAEHAAPASYGGPVEPKGRLRYIDGCSDTVLASPPRLGDPCTNALYFIEGVNQTRHTHPTVRMGMVFSGEGFCLNAEGHRVDMKPGSAWVIPPDYAHSFHTEIDQELVVLAYHPDSEVGPTDDDHPMIRRTFLDDGSVATPDSSSEVL